MPPDHKWKERRILCNKPNTHVVTDVAHFKASAHTNWETDTNTHCHGSTKLSEPNLCFSGLKREAIHLYTHAACERKKERKEKNPTAYRNPCSRVFIMPPNQAGCEDSPRQIQKKPVPTFKTLGRAGKKIIIIAWLCLLHPTPPPPLWSRERRTSPFPRIQGVAAQKIIWRTPRLPPFTSPGISSSKSMSSCPSSSLLSDPGIFIS